MKIFERDGKYNFVDDNNVFVGFDASQSCCEQFGFGLTFFKPDERIRAYGENAIFHPIPHDTFDLTKFAFNTEFFETFTSENSEGTIAVFRLIDDNHNQIFLHLYNFHNGYYAHGFEMCRDGVVLFRGIL